MHRRWTLLFSRALMTIKAGRAASAVVEHYNRNFGLNLTAAQKADLVEYLKSL